MSRTTILSALLASLALASLALPALAAPEPPSRAAAGAPRQFDGPALRRADFNRLAIHANLPLYWIEDKNGNKLLDPEELGASGLGNALAPYVQRGKFTKVFVTAYQALVDLKRRESVRRELDAGRPALLVTDLTRAPAPEKALLANLLTAARIIDDLYLRQTGAFVHKGPASRTDPASQALFLRNSGPWCQSPLSKGDPFCNALSTFPPRRSEAYPAELEQNEAMCQQLQAHPDSKQLLDPFTVVRKQGEKLVAVPYLQIFGAQMRQVAARLKAAAAALAKDASEKALVQYLLAAAKGFETNKWADADEAWARMSSQNSKWYLRIAPDEVYFDPCQQKAGFHLSLARIDKTLLEWQKKLTPLRSEMEQAFARLVGKPYAARQVRFQMPDFIEVVLNAGDSRHPLGAVIGQSLPNWGAVSSEGRGRTVVMTNFYSDPDSRQVDTEKARLLLGPSTLAWHTTDPLPDLINIMLHEAAHNFGPYSDYKIGGKVPKEIFGGKVASTLEELKAQTAGMWYLALLRKKGLIDDAILKRAYVKCLTWGFGHISQGMFEPSGNVRPYGQLAAIQVGSFVRDGALSFERGKFSIAFDRLPGAVEKLLARVGRIKAAGDKAGAEQLINDFIKGPGHALVHEPHIAEQLLRYPKASFRYAVVY